MAHVKQFIDYVQQNWPMILEYMLMFIAYFLVFLYRSKVKTTKRDLTVLFQDKAKEVVNTDKILRDDMNATRGIMEKELAEAKHKYEEAINKISGLESRLCKTEKAFIAMLYDSEVSGE